MTTVELCRPYGINDMTFYKWRSKYGCMEFLDAKCLKSLEDENARLEKLLVESVMDVATLCEMLSKTSNA
ncbi:putative transposase [Bartonella apihabitans]|nr:putative transposase [Bartonella apihabitans]